MKTVTKKEYYMLYFQTYSLNREDKKERLTLPEIKLLAELLTHNDGKSNFRQTSPYYGQGRKEIRENLGMANTTYSNTLNKLRKKGFLIKLGNDTDYALNINLQKLQNHVNETRKLFISYSYQIDDSGNSKKNENTGE